MGLLRPKTSQLYAYYISSFNLLLYHEHFTEFDNANLRVQCFCKRMFIILLNRIKS
jgi:hypothetical protein